MASITALEFLNPFLLPTSGYTVLNEKWQDDF